MPQDFYFRVDSALFIGPYLHGVTSQQTLSMEFAGSGDGFRYWTAYFKTLWDDPQFCRTCDGTRALQARQIAKSRLVIYGCG